MRNDIAHLPSSSRYRRHLLVPCGPAWLIAGTGIAPSIHSISGRGGLIVFFVAIALALMATIGFRGDFSVSHPRLWGSGVGPFARRDAACSPGCGEEDPMITTRYIFGSTNFRVHCSQPSNESQALTRAAKVRSHRNLRVPAHTRSPSLPVPRTPLSPRGFRIAAPSPCPDCAR